MRSALYIDLVRLIDQNAYSLITIWPMTYVIGHITCVTYWPGHINRSECLLIKIPRIECKTSNIEIAEHQANRNMLVGLGITHTLFLLQHHIYGRRELLRPCSLTESGVAAILRYDPIFPYRERRGGNPSLKVKGKVFYGQEPPSGESITTEFVGSIINYLL